MGLAQRHWVIGWFNQPQISNFRVTYPPGLVNIQKANWKMTIYRGFFQFFQFVSFNMVIFQFAMLNYHRLPLITWLIDSHEKDLDNCYEFLGKWSLKEFSLCWPRVNVNSCAVDYCGVPFWYHILKYSQQLLIIVTILGGQTDSSSRKVSSSGTWMENGWDNTGETNLHQLSVVCIGRIKKCGTNQYQFIGATFLGRLLLSLPKE